MEITAAVVKKAGGPFELETFELEEPRADEVLVRIVSAGVCHTDITCRDALYPTPFPIVLGHEGAGIVEAVGSAITGLQIGDHVITSYMRCGECRNCRRGDPSRCVDIFPQNFSGARADGSHALHGHDGEIHDRFFGQSSFATHAIGSVTNTVKVTADAPLEFLGPLACGVQSGAGAVMNTLRPEPGSSIAVFGCGSVGLSAIMAARVMGCAKIIGVDIVPDRLEFARELGATDVVNADKEDVVEAIQSLTGDGADYSVECAGLPEVLSEAVNALTVSGTCCLVGAAPLGTESWIDMNSIMFGRTLTGAIEGNAVPEIFLPRLIELQRQGLFGFEKLITHFKLDEINAAFTGMEDGSVIKPVLLPQAGG